MWGQRGMSADTPRFSDVFIVSCCCARSLMPGHWALLLKTVKKRCLECPKVTVSDP